MEIARDSTDVFVHKSLINLNNAGAVLLQRNRFEEAYDTYLDALFVLEGLELDLDDDNQNWRNEIHARVAGAARRLEASTFCGSGSCAQQWSPSGLLRASIIQQYCRSGGKEGRILRQESIYLNEDSLFAKASHEDLTSSVVIYNFALCNLKMAILNVDEMEYFLESGTLLMKHAYSALLCRPPLSNVEDFSSIVTMSIIILSFLLDVGAVTRDESAHFQELLRLAKEGLSMFSVSLSAAAAA
jgi:hypothetical protein